jgi:O-antigen ligase
MLAGLGGLAVSLIFSRGRAAGVGFMMLFAMIVGIVGFGDEVSSVVFWGKSQSNIETGSGRVPIWKWVLLERMPSCPIVGFGFGPGEAQARLYNIGGFRMQHMHNGTMSAIANLGAVGLCVWLLFVYAIARAALRQREPGLRVVLIGGVTAVLINSLTCESVPAPLTMVSIAHLMLFTTVAAAVWEGRFGTFGFTRVIGATAVSLPQQPMTPQAAMMPARSRRPIPRREA